MEKYAKKLIENMHPTYKCQHINLVLDGGLFNGSYLAGGMFFLKELEDTNRIKIKKISTCSISSFAALFYYAGLFDLFTYVYNAGLKQFKKHNNIDIFDKLFKKIKDRLPTDFKIK